MWNKIISAKNSQKIRKIFLEANNIVEAAGVFIVIPVGLVNALTSKLWTTQISFRKVLRDSRSQEQP
jgi:hypothetical protein